LSARLNLIVVESVELLLFLARLNLIVVESVELLGVKISKILHHWMKILLRTKEKVISRINFRERFRLTLQGRIAIGKTFMLPLVNCLGCIFEPSQKILNEIQNVIYNFIKKKN
jgi:hypothetical protein